MSPPKKKERLSRPYFQSSNVPKALKLPKGKLDQIDFGEYEEQIKRIWEGKPPLELIQHWKEMGYNAANLEKHYNGGNEKGRYGKIQKLLGYGNNKVGYCSLCKRLNTHILRQKIEGAVIVTRFCSEHVPT